MCYDIVSETALPYLSDLLHLYSPYHSFQIPRWNKKFQGQCTFAHLGSVTWNELPYSVHYVATKSQFKTTQDYTIPLSQWTILLNFFWFRCQSYPHPLTSPLFPACMHVNRHTRACVSVYERERETEIWGWVYVCVRVDVWEAVIWCMGVGVKADRMRIVIIIMPHI